MGIFRLYNQNRVMFWTIVSAIIVVLLVVHIMNSIVKTNNEKPKNIVIDEKLYENKLDIDEQISDEQVEEEKELIIDQFIRLCNSKNTQSAYNLLSEECKEELFPTLEAFQQNYVTINFNTQKLYGKKQYKGNTYEITFYENMLVTGTSSNSQKDYYTIVNRDGKSKLNISNYVKRENTNRTTKNNYLQVEVVKKDIYIDYEVYELKVTNLTPNTIILDTKENTKTMYLTDEKGIIYYSAGHEVLDSSLLIKPKATNTIQIKYTKGYKSNNSQKLYFEDIVLNDMQNTNEDKKIKMEVNI